MQRSDTLYWPTQTKWTDGIHEKSNKPLKYWFVFLLEDIYNIFSVSAWPYLTPDHIFLTNASLSRARANDWCRWSSDPLRWPHGNSRRSISPVVSLRFRKFSFLSLPLAAAGQLHSTHPYVFYPLFSTPPHLNAHTLHQLSLDPLRSLSRVLRAVRFLSFGI